MAEYTATSGSYTTTLTVTEGAYDVASNSSPVTFTLTLKKNSGTGLWNNDSCPWSININGTSYSGSFTYDFRSYSSLTLKSSTTQSVTHNSDGTKEIAVSASVNMNNTPYVYTMSPNGTLTLATIPRASDVSVASSYSIANTSSSLSATISPKANFYHRWKWSIGSYTSGWTTLGQSSATQTISVANTSMLSQLPSATSGSVTFTVETHNGNAYSSSTLVGSKTATSTVSVNTSNIKPSVSLGTIGINSSPISGYAVAGHSKVQSAWSTSNSYGATSVTTYFTVSTGSLATTSSSSTSGTVVSNVIPSNTSNYTLYIYAYAKDSRGAVSSTVSKSITVYGYQLPTANLTAYRTSSSSSTSEDGAGTYAYVTFSGAVRSSVNSQNTIQSTVCTYSGSISGTATNGGHYALADTQTVTFTLTVTDKVTSSTASVTIATASYPLDLYDDGNGNVGVGIGTIAVANTFKTGITRNDFTDSRTLLGRHVSYDGSSTGAGTGYVVLMTLKIKTSWANKSVHLEVQRRGNAYPSNLCIRFDGVDNQDPSLNKFSADSYVTDFFMYKSGTGTWQLITYKTNYDIVSINDIQIDGYIASTMDFDFTQSVLSSVPSGAVQATNWSYAQADLATLATNADNATNAVNSNRLYVSRTAASANTDFIQNVMVVKEYQNTASNIPTAHYYHTLNIMGPDTNYATQLALGMTTNAIFYRRFNNGTWTSWRRVDAWTTIWTGTLKGQNGITLDVSGYQRIRVWCVLYGVTGHYDIDLTKGNAVQQVEGHPYSSGITIAEYTANGVLELMTSQAVVNTNKNWFFHWHCGYQSGATATNKDNNNDYYIYRIDGII